MDFYGGLENMNDFRNKHQPGRSPARSNSIDGFTRPAQNSSKRVGGQPAGTPNRLDDFTRTEGFAARNRTRSVHAQTPVQTAAPNISDEPIIIEKQPQPIYKRGLLGLGRKQLQAAKLRKPLTKKQKIKRGAIAFLVILMLLFGFLVWKGYINISKVLGGGGGAPALGENVDPSKLRGEGDGRVNILLMGRGGQGHEGADLTDTLILASIDPIANEAALVSIPRDLYVPVADDDYGSMKINTVFASGKGDYIAENQGNQGDLEKQGEEAGYKLLEKTIEKNLGVPVHYRAVMDFNGFEKAVDTVGGVDLNVPSPVYEVMRINGQRYVLDVQPGQQHMDGFEALAYSRSRYTSPRGDFDRSERQRQIIIALKEKIMSAGTYSNPAKISGLLDNLGNNVSTNFSLGDLQRLHEIGQQIGSGKISSIGLADPPNDYVTTSNVGGLSVVVPKAGIGNYDEIRSYMRNALKDSFLRNENAQIAVYNGTEVPGLAKKKADELKSYGYNVTVVANAPTKGYEKTVISDLRDGSKKYTRNYLEKRFNVSASNSLPNNSIQPGTADFVIILGSDQSQ